MENSTFLKISMLNHTNTEPYTVFNIIFTADSEFHAYFSPKDTVSEILIPHFFDISIEFQKYGDRDLEN